MQVCSSIQSVIASPPFHILSRFWARQASLESEPAISRSLSWAWLIFILFCPSLSTLLPRSLRECCTSGTNGPMPRSTVSQLNPLRASFMMVLSCLPRSSMTLSWVCCNSSMRRTGRARWPTSWTRIGQKFALPLLAPLVLLRLPLPKLQCPCLVHAPLSSLWAICL